MVDRVEDTAWVPFPILETHDGAPIYFPPAIFPIPRLDGFGLALGTGDREDLWGASSDEGRFYIIVDDGFDISDVTNLGSCDQRLPVEDSCLTQIAWNDPPPVLSTDSSRIDNTINHIQSPEDNRHRGWTMTFPVGFRMTSDPFIASGILFYSFFQPIAFVPEGDGTSSSGSSTDPEPEVCARTGITRSFVVLARNGNPVARLSGDPQASDPEIDGTVIGDSGGVSDPGATTDGQALGSRDRYHKIGEFTTAPFVDRVSSKNPPSGASGGTFADLVDPQLERDVLEVVMEDYPRGSRFNNAFRLAVAALRNSTGVHVYATVPVALYPADWREDNVSGLDQDGN